MIVATAGHIDHGKTLLVKTLTGVDTDRLPEEKARGISIDLGFAYLPVGDGRVIGFVDVPGHERFIRNMLAGVCGIDFALLVVAADDGVMPQTREHLHILDLLHVHRGAAVITKIDRVDSRRVAEVERTVAALLDQTALADARIVAVSAAAGQGITALRELLTSEARAHANREDGGQQFRYAIDRVFTVPGSGTVVTGTVFNGVVNTGDRLVVSPAGTDVRIRAIQIQGKPAQRARAGERCALNLTGGGLESVGRGDWVLAAALHRPTQRFDARIKILEAEAYALEHWTPLHVHLATSDVTARIATRRGVAVAPGASTVAQLVLDQPIGTLRGDRFILRDQSGTRTLGGGFVLDPFAPATRRSTRNRLSELAALEHESAHDALTALLESDQPVDLGRFELTYNLSSDRAHVLYERSGLVQLGKDVRVGIKQSRHASIAAGVVTHVREFHRRQPQAAGEDLELLRHALAPDLSADSFGTVLRRLADERKIEAGGSTVRLPNHNPTANAADDRLWQIVRPALEAAAFNPPPIRELAAQLKLKDAILKDFLYRKAKSGEVMRVGAERFYPRQTLATLAAIAQALAQGQSQGLFTAAQYRDATGVGRSLAIEILEFMDGLGVTQRVGDARKMRRDFVPILGAATVPPRPPVPAAAKTAPGQPSAARRMRTIRR